MNLTEAIAKRKQLITDLQLLDAAIKMQECGRSMKGKRIPSVRLDSSSKRVLDALKEGPKTVPELHAIVGGRYLSLNTQLMRLCHKGWLARVKFGVYSLPGGG